MRMGQDRFKQPKKLAVVHLCASWLRLRRSCRAIRTLQRFLTTVLHDVEIVRAPAAVFGPSRVHAFSLVQGRKGEET